MQTTSPPPPLTNHDLEQLRVNTNHYLAIIERIKNDLGINTSITALDYKKKQQKDREQWEEESIRYGKTLEELVFDNQRKLKPYYKARKWWAWLKEKLTNQDIPIIQIPGDPGRKPHNVKMLRIQL